MPATEAVQTMNQRAGEPKPLSGAFWVDGQLHLRLEGTASAVQHTARQWGGQVLEAHESCWDSLREWTLPFFDGTTSLWRFSHQSTAPVDESFGPTLIDWAGAQRWVRGEHAIAALQQVAHNAGGHVTCFRGGDRSADVRSPVSAVEHRLQQRLKATFDPLGILNPGRLYSWL
jgi:glycolate oxidase FAD binding subunit